MNLSTDYLGLRLRNPVVASAGPLSQTVEGIKSLADGGVGAVVMYSLFEEQLRREAESVAALEDLYDDSFAEALSYFPSVPQSTRDASHAYLKLVEDGARAIDVPLIASLNGASVGGWTQSARRLADAGAAAVELNIYFVPGDITVSGREVEERHLEILSAVKSAVDIPVAVKLVNWGNVYDRDAALKQMRAEAAALARVKHPRVVRFIDFGFDPRWPYLVLEFVEGRPLGELVRSGGALPTSWALYIIGQVLDGLAAVHGDPGDLVFRRGNDDAPQQFDRHRQVIDQPDSHETPPQRMP